MQSESERVGGMERICLTKDEKRALRNVMLQSRHLPENMGIARFSVCVSALERKGLVKAARSSGGEVASAELTQYGKIYIEANPSLRNPIDWKWAIPITFSSIALIIAIIGIVRCL